MRDTNLRQTKVRLVYGRRRGRSSAAHVAHAILGVVALAVAVGYLAGVAFWPSSKAVTSTIPQTGLYATVETLPPQTTATPTRASRSLVPSSDGGGQATALEAPRTSVVTLRIAQPQNSTAQQSTPQSTPQPAPFSAGRSPAAASMASGAADSLAVARRFHVEIGTYQNPIEAEAVARDLRRRGYAVHVGQGPPYGVRVGGLLDRPTAERLVKLLSAAGFDATLTAR